jgi:hypothetical protein
LNLLKAFKNWQDWPWPALKSGGLSAASFSKENCSLETYLVDFKTKRLALADFQKALGVAPGNMLSKRSKEFELSGLQKLHAKKNIWHYM